MLYVYCGKFVYAFFIMGVLCMFFFKECMFNLLFYLMSYSASTINSHTTMLMKIKLTVLLAYNLNWIQSKKHCTFFFKIKKQTLNMSWYSPVCISEHDIRMTSNNYKPRINVSFATYIIICLVDMRKWVWLRFKYLCSEIKSLIRMECYKQLYPCE